jgi:hypothetical protein
MPAFFDFTFYLRISLLCASGLDNTPNIFLTLQIMIMKNFNDQIRVWEINLLNYKNTVSYRALDKHVYYDLFLNLKS